MDSNNPDWKNIKFCIFDAPLVKGSFKQRLAVIERELKDCDDQIVLLKQTVCKSTEHLE